ncbi:hypothetical protein D9611_005463 [Ephemerocybe angulata]|uniref:F-box domain-containing protein n=1 Tax=Ephemerocybe angulata TaxID=980116 RepID=A0A8H5FDP0_9AGAR|nr:hypothetical protein D9611_005463 [Tulosesus angulatus]
MSFLPKFLPLLDTNHIPSLEEVYQLKAQLQEWDDIIAKVAADRKALEQVQAYLKDQHELCVEYRRRHIAALEPTQRVPDEILSTIFIHCLPNSDIQQWPEHMCIGKDYPAVALSGVCRRWRRVALTTPRLWSYIFVHFERCSRYDTLALSTKLLQDWTCRSRACPIFVRVEMEGVPAHLSGASLQRWIKEEEGFVEVLVASVGRWASLSMSVTELERTSPFLAILQEQPPFLRSVLLDVSFHGEQDTAAIANSPLLQTPSLRSCTLARPCGRITQLPARRMGQLTELVIESLSTKTSVGLGARDALWLLGQLPRLLRASLYFDDDRQPMSGTIKSVSLSKLESLSLKGFVIDGRFADLLILGSLHTLAVSSLKLRNPGWQKQGIRQFLSYFGQHLQAVELDVSELDAETFITLVDRLPNAERLKITDFAKRYGSNTICATMLAGLVPWLLPSAWLDGPRTSGCHMSGLKEFTVVCRYETRPIAEALVQLVAGRYEHSLFHDDPSVSGARIHAIEKFEVCFHFRDKDLGEDFIETGLRKLNVDFSSLDISIFQPAESPWY